MLLQLHPHLPNITGLENHSIGPSHGMSVALRPPLEDPPGAGQHHTHYPVATGAVRKAATRASVVYEHLDSNNPLEEHVLGRGWYLSMSIRNMTQSVFEKGDVMCVMSLASLLDLSSILTHLGRRPISPLLRGTFGHLHFSHFLPTLHFYNIYLNIRVHLFSSIS